jgi:DNA-directed RNA polymerase specialized sigma24 family protein
METKLDEIGTQHTAVITDGNNLNLLKDEGLYRVLCQYVKWWVHQADISEWHGVESFIIEDIVQSVFLKVFTYLQGDGNTPSITYLRNYSLRVAQIVVTDLIRKSHKQRWLLVLDSCDSFSQEQNEESFQSKSSIQKKIAAQISRQIIRRLRRHLKENRQIFTAYNLPFFKKKHRCKRKICKSRSIHKLSIDSSSHLDLVVIWHPVNFVVKEEESHVPKEYTSPSLSSRTG